MKLLFIVLLILSAGNWRNLEKVLWNIPNDLRILGQGCREDELRVDCHPDKDASEEECLSRGCEWCPSTDEGNTPWCYVPDNYGYKMVGTPNNTQNGLRVNLQKVSSGSMFGGDIENLVFEAFYESNYRLRIKITDADKDRWEVPMTINPATGGNGNPLYELVVSNDPVFSFRIIRRSSGITLFDSILGGFIFADQFIQIATTLPSTAVYGIGENEQHTFKHDLDNRRRWALFARDQPPAGNANMYGAQPYYTVLETHGNVHSVAIVNSNAQEFEMTNAPGIVYRTIGGILDMYFFLGPTPESVVEQFTQAVGRSHIPPYWALGFQLCRYGYDNIEILKETVDRTAQYNIPHDVQYLDIDVMQDQMDFTVDEERFPNISDYIRELKEKGIKFMTILDPAIAINQENYDAFDSGQELDVWIKKSNGEPMTGRVWPGDMEWPVYFPDFSKLTTRLWWYNLIQKFKKLLDFDGLWIDMNEPANFDHGDSIEGCEVNKWNNPPYVPSIVNTAMIEEKTICMDHVEYAGLHYNTHNLYGWFQSRHTLDAVQDATDSRGFVLSRSTFLGSGKWIGHWLGDNWSNWTNLHYSIIGTLQYNQFGIPFVGPDICGFIGDTTEQMCQRWMELGAFYPFARNHNGKFNIEQDPGVFGEAVAESSRKALEIRYTLLPYLYTLFYKHSVFGSTVARPLWHEFPRDSMAIGIDRQFMWGSGLLISPVLDEDHLSVDAYFPDARFFSYYDGSEVLTRFEFETLDAPLDFIPLHLRGGNVIPTQEPAINTVASRKNPLGLIVALDDNERATGNLYYDDGIRKDPVLSEVYFYATFFVQNGIFLGEVEHNRYLGMDEMKYETMRILGVKNPVSQVFINGAEHLDWETKPSGEVLVSNMGIWATSNTFTVSFF